MDKLIPAKPSEQQIQEAAPLRKQFRDQVIADNEIFKKSQSIFTQLKVQNKSNLAVKIIEKELAWLNSNVEVTKQQISSRKTAYTESLQLVIKDLGESSVKNINKVDPKDKQNIINNFPFAQYKGQLQAATTAEKRNEEAKKKAEDDKVRNRSTGQVIWDAFLTAAFWAFIAVFLLLSLRIASLNANANLWRPLPYRVLNFTYTFLYGFIWVPYYLLWEFKSLSDKILEKNPEKRLKRPIWYSLFPMTPYIPVPPKINAETGLPEEEPLSLDKLFFGYPDTQEVRDWIQCKCETWTKLQECAARSTVFADLVKEMEEEKKA
jgi:hypothetical protein